MAFFLQQEVMEQEGRATVRLQVTGCTPPTMYPTLLCFAVVWGNDLCSVQHYNQFTVAIVFD